MSAAIKLLPAALTDVAAVVTVATTATELFFA